MPTINVSGATANSASAKSNLVDKFNKDPNYVSGSEQLIRRSAREALQKQSRWDKLVETAERQNYQWDKRFEQKRRAQDERELRLDAQSDTRARRQKEQAERSEARKKETLIDRFNRNYARQQDQQTAQRYRYMRSEADYMNRQFDRQRAQGAGGMGRSGYANSFGDYGSGAHSLPGRLAFGGAKRLLSAAGLESLGGIAAGTGGLALAGLGATYEAPHLYSKLLGDAVGGAQQFYGVQTSAARLARGGGGSYSDLINGVFPKSGRPPQWMSDWGYTPQSALDMASKARQPISSMQQLRSIDSQIGAAGASAYLGANSPDVIAGLTGLFTQVSGSRNTSSTAGNWSADGSNSSGQVADFYRKWQSLTQAAMTRGLDASNVAHNLSDLFTSMSGAGGVGVSAGNAANFINQMQAGGGASMRTGTGIRDAAGAASAFADSSGYGGSSSRTMATLFEARKRNKGKLPTTRAAMEKVFGVTYANLAPADKKAFDNALSAARAGDGMGFATLSAGLITANPGWAISAAQDYSSTLGLPGYKQSIVSASLLTGNTGASSQSIINAYVTGNKSKLGGGNLGWSQVDPAYRAIVDKVAKADNLDPSVVAALFKTESGFNPASYNRSGGGFGARGFGNVRKPALDDLHAHGIDKDITANDLFDPYMGAKASADYFAMLKKRNHGNEALALQAYRGSDSATNSAYAQSIEQMSVVYAPNPQARANAANAALGQAQTLSSYQDAGIANALSSGDLGSALQGADGAARALTDDMSDLSTVIRKFITNLKGSAGPGITPLHQFSRPPATP